MARGMRENLSTMTESLPQVQVRSLEKTAELGRDFTNAKEELELRAKKWGVSQMEFFFILHRG